MGAIPPSQGQLVAGDAGRFSDLDARAVTGDQLKTYESLLSRVAPPISNDEARSLLRLFGPDDCYGLAWTLLHLIESASGWPLYDCLKGPSNAWTERLRLRAERGSHV